MRWYKATCYKFLPVSQAFTSKRKSLQRGEWMLFLLPILVLGAGFWARPLRQTLFPVPAPKLVPKPTPIPPPNLYSNYNGTPESILVSPDGKTIHTGDPNSENKFQTWDAITGRMIRRFGRFYFNNADAVLSPNGRILGFGYGGWKGDRIVLLDSTTGREKLRIKELRPTGYALNDEVIAMPTDDDVRFFSTINGKYVGKLRHRMRDFFPAKPEFSRDGRLLLWIGSTGRKFEAYANGNANDEIVWFDWKKKKLIHAITLTQTDLRYACFSGDGKVILAIGFCRYWVKSKSGKNAIATQKKFFAVDAQTGKQLYSWPIKTSFDGITASPDGKWFAFSKGLSDYETLAIYEVRTGTEVHRVENKSYTTGAWSPDSKTFYMDGSKILYTENDNIWRLYLTDDGQWELDKGKELSLRN